MRRRVRALVAVLALGLAATVLSAVPGSAEAAERRRAREKMVEFNKEALLSYEVKDWVTAKDLLLKALREAKLAGLEDNNMTARTYIHLGAVEWAGFRHREAAIQRFATARKIRPDIDLTPALETPELRSLFEIASKGSTSETATTTPESAAVSPAVPTPAPTPTPEPTPEPAPVPAPRPTPPAIISVPINAADGSDEPDLPEVLSAPLMCTVPAVIPPEESFTFRCALDPNLRPQQVQLHYRSRGATSYLELDMRRTAKGWYLVTLPASETKSGALQVYFDARDESDNPLASNGQADSPSVIAIREGDVGRSSSGRDDPMAHIKAAIRAEQYEAGLHRRRAGAIWVGMGAGRGWGYVPAGRLEWERQVEISAMATTTGLFHILPEFGYMVTDNFAVAVQGRLEFIKQEQATYIRPGTNDRVLVAANLDNAPATTAPALFARAIGYTDITSGGNLRLSFSADVGAGYLRFPVKPVGVPIWDPERLDYVPDYRQTIAKTDTRAVSGFLGGFGLGILWNLSRHFAVSITGRALTGFPNWGVVTEGAMSLEVAFGGAHGPETAPEEGDDVVTKEEPEDTRDEWDGDSP